MESYLKLKYKNKASLIRRTLHILKISSNIFNEIERNAVTALIEGYGFNKVLQEVKNGGANLPNYFENQFLTNPFDFLKVWPGSVKALKDTHKIFIGQKFNIKISVTNETNWLFATTDKSPIFASYHWCDKNGEIIIYDGIRSALPMNIWPGETSEFYMSVIAPNDSGDYLLSPSLVFEGFTWLEERGLSITKEPIHIYEEVPEMHNKRTIMLSEYLKKLNFARGPNANIN